MRGELVLCEGDLVELRPGAPVPASSRLQPGARGTVVVAEARTELDRTGDVTVLFHQRRAIRLHHRWLRLVERPAPRRGHRASTA